MGTRMTILRFGVALGLLSAFLSGCTQEPTFRGNALDPPRAVRDFTLTDQFGMRVRPSDFQGQVVVLTFLYTSCPDLCPLVTRKLRKAIEFLDDLAPEVAILAVTVDPEGDTPERVHTYSQQHGMLDRWHFLTGEANQLQPIWEYYWVGKVWKDENGDVMHQAPVHLINRQGMIRVVHGSTFRPADLAHDITILLRG